MQREIPIPIGWKVIIQPKAPKEETVGGIVIAKDTQEAEKHLIYIGQIIAMGEACFMTKTTGGLDMSQWAVRPQVGDWAVYSPYAGIRIRQAGRNEDQSSEHFLLLMNDTDIHAIVDDPANYYGWVDV